MRKVIPVAILIFLVLGFVIGPLLRPKAPKRALRYNDVIASPALGIKIKYGEPFKMGFNSEIISYIDSSTILVNDKTIPVNMGSSVTIAPNYLRLGTNKVNVNMWEDGRSQSVDFPLTVVSDIKADISKVNVTVKKGRDPKSYTQGLEWYDGILYESGGQYGASLLRKVNPTNGKVLKTVNVDKKYFAEGITIFGQKIYMLTWQEKELLVWDLDLNLLETQVLQTTSGEGWGICNDGTSLIISDGSHNLTYLNPKTFQIEKVAEVWYGDQPLAMLNELEYVEGIIYANVYTTSQVVAIDAESGRVMKVYDLQLLKDENPKGEVLNGIAYLPKSKTFMVTGKSWQHMYEVQF